MPLLPPYRPVPLLDPVTARRSSRKCSEYFEPFQTLPVPSDTASEGGMRCEIDAKPGIGWSEFMWPTAYLDFLRKEQRGTRGRRSPCSGAGIQRPVNSGLRRVITAPIAFQQSSVLAHRAIARASSSSWVSSGCSGVEISRRFISP